MIHLIVAVENATELLATEAYGTGAVLRWERAAAEAGPFTEGGTVSLVAGTVSYDVWDTAGVVGTWYRTRVSNAAASTFSAYSDVRLGTPGSVTAPSQVRALVPTALTDDQLQEVIDREEAALARQIGPLSGARTQTWHLIEQGGPWPITGFQFSGSGSMVASDRMRPLLLLRPADTVEVVDNGVTVDAADLRVIRNGTQIERASGGWTGPIVSGTYTPNDLPEVIRVVIGLVRLTLTETGYQSEKIGDYEYTRAAAATAGGDPRKALIRSLMTQPVRGTLALRTSNDSPRVGAVVTP